MRSYTEVEAETPDQIRTFWETPGTVSAPNGESWDAVTTRIDRALARLNHLPEVIVVAHFGAIIAAIQRHCLGKFVAQLVDCYAFHRLRACFLHF